MTTESSRAASLLPMTIARYQNASGEFIPMAFSLVEQDRARRAVLRVINTFHFRTGSNVLITSTFNEALQYMPFERAVMTYGMVAVSADSTPWDAKRVEAIARQFSLTAAAGICKNVVDGLSQLGFNIETLLAGIPVWARPDIYDELKASPTITPFRYLELGPAIALECVHGNGAHIDRCEWDVTALNGEIVISSKLPRCQEFTDYRTGVKGSIINSPCNCGNPDPRIMV